MKFVVGLFCLFNLFAIAETTYRAGDYKENYDADYITQSKSLNDRNVNKQGIDLLIYSQQKQLGLPALKTPADNPLTHAKISLGRKLFYDRRLSLNNTFSCASCHVPEQGFTSNELATSVGIEGRIVRRNAPSLYNVGYLDMLFHDGRENSLELQVWSPLLARNEMANPSFSMLLEKIKNTDNYLEEFITVFNQEPDIVNVGQALASYQRTLIAGNSRFDKWYYGKQEDALTQSEKNGFKLFTGKAGCNTCHLIQADYALLTDQKLHNTGTGYAKSMQVEPEFTPVQVAPGVTLQVKTWLINQVGAAIESDVGRYEVTEAPDDRWKFKTPSLRNVALSAPYMHNGSMLTLQQVVQFYNKGGAKNDLLSSLIRPLELADDEVLALVAFMQSLTSSHVNQLVEDAFAAPIGDIN